MTRERGTWDKTHAVTHYLGAAMIIAVVGAEILIYVVVTADTAVEPAAVALVGVVGQIATLLIGGLIGMVVGKHLAQKAVDAAGENTSGE